MCHSSCICSIHTCSAIRTIIVLMCSAIISFSLIIFFTVLWRKCMDIFFHANVTIASMDDDQLQLRSILLALVGIIRKHNPAKRFGPIQDLVGAFGTGAMFAGNLVAGGQSAQDSFEATLKFMSDLHPVLNIIPGIFILPCNCKLLLGLHIVLTKSP